MNGTLTRGEAIGVKCRDCIHDEEAAGTWRQQVSACPVTGCALWRFRPLAGGVPACIAARDASRLPDDWSGLSHDVAVGIVAGRIAASPHGCTEQAIGDPSPGGGASPYPEAA